MQRSFSENFVLGHGGQLAADFFYKEVRAT